MKYLLDTHIILWSALDVKKLSRKAKAILENPDNVLFSALFRFGKSR